MGSFLPTTAFVHPLGENRDQIEVLMRQVTTGILDYLTGAGRHTPLPTVEAIDYALIPPISADLDALLGQLQTLMAQSMNPAHPGFMGHMDPLPTTLSMLGDWVVAALNNNMLSVEMSPALSRLEPLLLREIAQMFGLGPQAGGVLVGGGSLANLQALTVARNVKLGTLQTGLAQQSRTPVILASAIAHSSIQKAAMVMGLGTEGVIAVPTNGQAQMDSEALRQAIQQAQTSDQVPFAVIATAGTTVTGNIDPLPAIAQVAHDYNLWFHVDAAYGGALIFSEQHRHRLQGIEQANSVTFNPQKWLYVTKTCASVLFRDMGLLDSYFRVAAPYMNTEDDWTNLGEITVQGTRHPDVLKLWLTLQHLGKRGCAELVDRSYLLTQHFVEEIRQRSHLELASEPEMNIVCFRGCPPNQPKTAWDQWNTGLQKYLLEQGNCFLSLPVLRSDRWLKAVLLNPYTTIDHIEALFNLIDTYCSEKT